MEETLAQTTQWLPPRVRARQCVPMAQVVGFPCRQRSNAFAGTRVAAVEDVHAKTPGGLRSARLHALQGPCGPQTVYEPGGTIFVSLSVAGCSTPKTMHNRNA